MSKTEGILKDALEKLNDKDATDKSVAPGAVETKPDTSNTQGNVEAEASHSNTTGIGESQKTATDEEAETDKSKEEAKDTTEDKSADKDEKLQHGMQEDTKLDDSGKVSDGDDDDDDKSALAGILKSVGFEDLSKSIKSQADVIKSSQDRVDETLKSLPDRLSEALSKSLDTYFEKNVITARNTTDLTQSEKDIDGSQDQSQKCDKVKKDDDDDDDDVEESSKKDKISTSEKSAEGKDETEKSFTGEGRAAQASDESDTVNKSMDSQEEAPKSYSPTEIVSKAVDLENKVADKKFTAKGRDWDKLDDIYKSTKYAREHLNSDALKSALSKFEDFIK